jgi:hypothetical protein
VTGSAPIPGSRIGADQSSADRMSGRDSLDDLYLTFGAMGRRQTTASARATTSSAPIEPSSPTSRRYPRSALRMASPWLVGRMRIRCSCSATEEGVDELLSIPAVFLVQPPAPPVLASHVVEQGLAEAGPRASLEEPPSAPEGGPGASGRTGRVAPRRVPPLARARIVRDTGTVSSPRRERPCEDPQLERPSLAAIRS